MALDNVKNIILILSGKGGVGKSSVTTQLALSLCLAGHSVGILDVDLTGPSIPRFLGIESAKIKQAPGGWLPVEVHSSQTLPPVPASFQDFSSLPSQNGAAAEPASATARNGAQATTTSFSPANSHVHQSEDQEEEQQQQHNETSEPVGSLYAMSLAFLLSSRSTAVVWRGPKKTAMVRQFLSDVLWPPLDYLLIDTPPGTSDEHISVIETLLKKVRNPPPTTPPTTSTAVNGAAGAENGTKEKEKEYPQLAGAVIVTTPQAVAVADVKKEINFCAKTGVKVVGVVENMSGFVCECCGEASNIFSKGGGEVMAHEFLVSFLGAAPIDGRWGSLVEEGSRPVYGVDQEEEEERREAWETEDKVAEAVEGGNTEEDIKDDRARDEALLVDKYRSCSLCPVFGDITRKVVETVENGTAVSVKPSNAR